MSRLDNAVNRLDAAVRRLEAAGMSDQRAASLEAELAAEREKYAQLAVTTDHVGAQLNQTIDRLKFILDA